MIKSLTGGQGLFRNTRLVLLFLLGLLLLLPWFTLAQNQPQAPVYTPLVGLPGLPNEGRTVSGFINAAYVVLVAVGALLAFLKISIAGAKYAVSDVITNKEDAKNDIKGALIGLAILVLPFIILNTIYPGLTRIDVLDQPAPTGIAPSLRPGVPPATGANPNQGGTNQNPQEARPGQVLRGSESDSQVREICRITDTCGG